MTTAERASATGEILDIMMPYWGSPEHFMIAVESVLAQDDPNWRLTIVDDVYPDAMPGEWASSIEDSRVTYIRNEENLRPSRNYNKCVGLAKSEFVVIMGCDDIMLPGYVGRIRRLIADFPDADIIQPGVTVIDENGTPVSPLADRVKAVYRPHGSGARRYEGETIATSLLRGFWPYFPSVAWRTSRVASGFRTDLDVTQDLAMMFEIISNGGSMVVDDEVVFAYRRHSASVSAVTGPDGSKFRQERVLFREAEASCRELGWRHAARAAHNHTSSRLHALTELPGAIASRNTTGMRTLTRHILGLPY
ncbi:glycosyltransferase [Salinibacterium sp. SYSU T00001]|uniref:glycosyltransferase n=1 Tax=Homoserinimonas sedimenticola TaxID=2986805 RepID=UPI0022366903|nr:glycosyltransferase [Salinibacterium sedimenticola]MCW4385019.1 glycosyltransferase [Salinibacterium sedimenticola]